MVLNVITAIISYLIGSINFSVILSKKIAGFDVREKGSGNAGSTNMLRSVGKKAAALTLICDILKGVAAILIAMFIGWIFNVENKSLFYIFLMFLFLFHIHPIYLPLLLFLFQLHVLLLQSLRLDL